MQLFSDGDDEKSISSSLLLLLVLDRLFELSLLSLIFNLQCSILEKMKKKETNLKLISRRIHLFQVAIITTTAAAASADEHG